MELDWSHAEKTSIWHHQKSHDMESTREEETRTTKKHLVVRLLRAALFKWCRSRGQVTTIVLIGEKEACRQNFPQSRVVPVKTTTTFLWKLESQR